MTENLITWNVTNWVTVVLMAFLGFFIVGTIAQFISSRKGTDNA